jgi:hypothetical protein
VLDNQQNLVDGRQRLTALRQLTTNRFLIGNVLDALQRSSAENVQLTHFKVDQTYAFTEATKATTNAETQIVTPGKPAMSVERIAFTLNAKDASGIPGDSISRFQASLSQNSFFHALVARTNDFRLTTSLTPQTDPEGKTFVAFTLQARLPDKMR